MSSCFSAVAQSTSSSPYSAFGIGNVRGSSLPQNRSMGGISAGLRRAGIYSDLNISNPASYSAITLTTFDIGASGTFTNLSKNSLSQKGFDAALSHIAFGVPVSKKSALSFGLLPYSDFGYSFRSNDKMNDTTSVDYLYRGEGGVSKVYLGYGFQIGKHLSLGLNASYLFGKLSRIRGAEFPADLGALSSKEENSTSVGGFNYEYGVQYFTNISPKTQLTIGYSGSAKTKINSSNKTVIANYRVIDNEGNETTALDTLFNIEGAKSKITVPGNHTFGFTLSQANHWTVGADLLLNNWSDYREGNTNPDFQNSVGIAVGAQIIPDVSAVSNYLKLIDYRLGFKYDKTYLNLQNTDIKQKSVTVGLGLPLPSNRANSFYKINIAAELGQRGTLENNLIRERFVNIYLGFTLNDRWFQKVKFD